MPASRPEADAPEPSDAPRIRGIVGACLTPFDDAGKVDNESLERQIEFLVKDCRAVAIGAVEAAEYTILRPEDRRQLVHTATAVVAGRVPVIAGVSAPAVQEVLALTEWAADCGADLVQVLMPARPWGGEPSSHELVDYFSQIAAGSPLPIVAYHNPAAGADPKISTWIELAEIPQVRYFKESSRDATKIARLIEEIELTGKAGYFTTMQPLLMTLMLGGSGATMPPPATTIGAEVATAVQAGDLATARLWQRVFGVFPGMWSSYGLVPVMKAAMRHFGVDIGRPLRPYRPLSPADDSAMGDFLRAAGVVDGSVVDAPQFADAVARIPRV